MKFWWFCLVVLGACGPGVNTIRSYSNYTSSVFGSAVRFTSSNQAVNITHQSLNLSNSAGAGATIEAWVRLDSLPATNAKIFEFGNSFFAPSLAVNPSGQVVATVPTNTGCTATAVFNSTTLLSVGKNYRLAMVAFQNGVAGSSFYINGILEGSSGLNLVVNTTCTGTYSTIGNANLLASYFPGTIDEVRVSITPRYSASFTPSQIPFSSDPYTSLLFHADSGVYTGGYLNTYESPGGIAALFNLSGGANYVSSPFP